MTAVKVPEIRPIEIRPTAQRVKQLLKPFGISASGLRSYQQMMEVVTENLMNVNTTRTPGGGPYQRKFAVLERDASGGVRVASVAEDATTGRLVYQPGHPDADENGNVLYPNVELMTEIADLMIARRVYEANATAFETAKTMIRRAIDI